MFDVGFSELVLLFIIGLLVLGPQRLPKVAAEIGKWVGRARRTATELRRQLEREIELNDLEPPPPPPPPTDPQSPATAPQAETGTTPQSAAPQAPPAAPSAAGAEHAPTEPPAAAHPIVGVPSDSAPAPETTKAPESTDRLPHG